MVFKVELYGDASITRELALAENQSLYTLAEAVVESYDFDFDHCFGFYNDFERWFKAKRIYELFKDAGEECSMGAKSVKNTKVFDAFALDKKLLFLFDYGDEWKFTVELTGKEDAVNNRKYSVLINKTNKSPEQYPPCE